MACYLSFKATALPKLVGEDREDGTRATDGRSGHISYGPYVDLEPGSYAACFRLRSNEPPEATISLTMDVVANDGKLHIQRRIEAGDLFTGLSGSSYLRFDVPVRATRLEVRLLVPEKANLIVKDLTIFSADLS